MTFPAQVSIRPQRAVLLPGTGSRAAFALRALGPVAAATGAATVIAAGPRAGTLLPQLRRALADAAAAGPCLVGGISIGGAVAAAFAAEHPVAALVVVMPAWLGAPDGAPAAANARWTAEQLRRDGLEPTIAAMTASSPPWLAAELAASWRAQWPWLPKYLDEAAAFAEPIALERIDCPTAVVALRDDPLHPLEVAEQWLERLPNARLAVTGLEDVGRDPALLGRLAAELLAGG